MKTDKELRQKMAEMFEDMEAEPQAESWENIANAIRPETKKRLPLWVLCACFALLLGGIGGVFYAWYYTSSANPIISSKSVKIKSPIILTEKCGDMPVKTFVLPEKEEEKTKTHAPKNKSLKPILLTNNENKPAILPEKDSISAPKIEIAETQIIENKRVKSNSPVYYPIYTKIQDIPIVENQLSNLSEDKLSFSSYLPKYPFSNIYAFPPKYKQKKGYFTASLGTLATFQLMQEQANPNYRVGKVNLLPTFDAKRLGFSAAFAYQTAISLHSEMRLGLTVTSLPQNASYQIENRHVFVVENLPNDTYSIARKAIDYQKQEKLWFVGAEMAYKSLFYIGNKKIGGFVGGEISGELRHLQLAYWLNAGAEIPVGYGLQLVPACKFQLNRQIDDVNVMKSRLYSVGLGLNYRWNR